MRPIGEPDIYARFRKHAHRRFGEAVARYIAEYQGKDKRRAAAALESTAPYVAHLKCIDVDDEALQQFKEDRKAGKGQFKKPAMVGTINKELTHVVTVLNKAARVWRWIPQAPKIEHLKGPTRLPYPLTWEEQDRLGRHLPTGWDVGAMCFAINTGVRKEELFGLKWTDLVRVPELGPDIFVFVLHGENVKNGHSRAVICNSIARRAVEAQRVWQMENGFSEFVFPTRASNRRGSKVRDGGKTWDQAWKDAGLPTGPLTKRGIHNCRHTFAHRLRAAGVPKEDRNALLGHANTDLAEHYSTPDIGRLLEHAEKVCVRKETTVLRAVG